MPTTLGLGTDILNLDPLPPLHIPMKLRPYLSSSSDHGLATTWLSEAVRNSTVSNTALGSWEHIRSDSEAAGELRVVIIGTSPTTGCGACEYDMFAANTSFAPEVFRSPRASDSGCFPPRCSFEHAWARQMHDLLNENSQFPVRSVIWAKNAVGPSFFASCTDLRVQQQVHLVLLELATNLWGSLDGLLQRIREAAPRAVVAFIAWPPQALPSSGRYRHDAERGSWPRDGYHSGELLDAAARAWSADVLHVGALMSRLPSHWGRYMLYAQYGRDRVHPNPVGHTLLGQAAARFVLQQLDEPDRRVVRSFVRSAGSIAAAQVKPKGFEKCYEHRFPTTATANGSVSGWHFVDDGAAKVIHKYGWRSNVKGEVLKIGPLGGPTGKNCSMLKLTLGYLLRMSELQGSLRLRCHGCECIEDQSVTRSLNPFPVIQTDASLSTDKMLRRNMSVTATTMFLALWRAHQRCYIFVSHGPHHRASRSSDHSQVSSVRVDSLTTEEYYIRSLASKALHFPKRYPDGAALAVKGMQCDPDACPSGSGWPCPSLKAANSSG